MSMSCRGLLLLFVTVFLVQLQSSTSLISSPSSIINPSKVKQVSSKPRFGFPQSSVNFETLSFDFVYFCHESENFLVRAFVYEGFLTDLECDHLISLVSVN